ncbi:amine oxidase [Rudanella paleaurantiibacter]|uniref:Amine oxidase n=1 Tax=Rudanella paleaurantiibacter TaxID=2614655 RepID=A0A7J5TSS4_9BACT|nr:amine oxidase [Rudanella paleaurantiibacter]KAB7726296.1 amine oxidase [Rudanella paleaurantiibacter]
MTISNYNQNPFTSFWWAGFECTDQLNCFGNRVDFLDITGHLALCDADYERIRAFDLQTVREGIGWSKVEKRPYQYDWSEVQYLMERGRVHGIQQVWDICHFGYADDLHPLHPMFARRFAALCRAFVQMYRDLRPDGPLVVTPINEVSFISWLGGDARGTQPYTTNQGFAVKYGLMRAYIEGIAAMREVDPTVRILTTEPLVNMVPPLHPDFEQIQQAAEAHTNQYQAVDMLAGRMCPELGGTEENLDILGFNYYYNNQWVIPTFDFLPWLNEGNDPRWRPLRSLLIEAYGRYKRPVALTETSHPGIDRPGWIRFVGEECRAAIEQGVPLWGVCLYPIIDRPDWDHLDREWHHSGLWDVHLSRAGQPPARVLYQPYADALRDVQQRVGRNRSVEVSG